MYVKHLKKTDKGCRHTPSEKKILLKKFLRGKEEKDAEQIPHIHCRKCEELLQLPAIYYSFWMKIIYMLASIIISGSAFEVLLKLAINGAIDILPCVLIGFVWISLGNLIFDRGVMFILVLVGRWRAFKVENQEMRRWIDVENHRYYERKKALNRMAKTGSAVAFLIIFILLKLDVRLSYAGIVFIVGIIIGL